MDFRATITKVPRTLFLVILLLFFLPAFSPYLVGGQFLGGNWADQIFLATTYWLFPLSIIFLILRRRLIFIPVFLAEISLLVGHTFFFGITHPNEMLMVRYYVMTLMGISTLLFVNRETLFPFLVEAKRGWRRDIRMRLKKDGEFFFSDAPERKLKINLDNISISGIALTGDLEPFSQLLHQKDKLPHFLFQLEVDGKVWLLNARLAHKRQVGAYLYIGLEVLNTEMLGKMIDSLIPAAGRPAELRFRMARQWLRTDLRIVAAAVWVLLMASIFFATPNQKDLHSKPTGVVTF